LFLSAFDIAAEVAKVDICKALPIFVEIEEIGDKRIQEVAVLGLSRKMGQRYSTKQKRISDVQGYVQSRADKFHLPKILEKFVYWLSSYDDEAKFLKLNSLPDVQRHFWMDPIEWIQVISVRETTFVSQNTNY
jgi:glucose-6-phosphate 1-dehydrogenase